MAVPAGRSGTQPTRWMSVMYCGLYAFGCVGSKRTQRFTVTTLHFQRVNGQQINEFMHLFFLFFFFLFRLLLLARAPAFSNRPLEFYPYSIGSTKEEFPNNTYYTIDTV